MTAEYLYFGCWNGPGHFLCLPSGIAPPGTFQKLPWSWLDLDGFLAPGSKITDHPTLGRLYDHPRTQPEGHGLLHHRDGWSAFAFWDRTGDKRMGSNSVFLVDREVPFAELIDGALAAFPSIALRLRGVELVVVGESEAS